MYFVRLMYVYLYNIPQFNVDISFVKQLQFPRSKCIKNINYRSSDPLTN